MRRFIILLLSSLSSAGLFAQGHAHLAERVYVSTDKDCYVAGDRIWCSAFCTDAATGDLSSFSSIAYLELHSSSGLAATAKIALKDGRGAGFIAVPNTVPTGNYRILAYTAQNVNEDGFSPEDNSRLVSIFNTYTSERVEGGVEISEIPLTEKPAESLAGLRITAGTPSGGTLPVRISNSSGQAASYSVSVYHDDGLSLPESKDIRSFVSRADVRSLSFTDRRIPEYDGEVVLARVAGADPLALQEFEGKFAFISVPGDRSDTYSCQIDADGNATFFTNNFYGDKDLFCQIEDVDGSSGAHLEIENSFVDYPVNDIPKLHLDPSSREPLLRRSVGSQIEKLFDADTLYSLLPVRENLLFGSEGITYVLDDYTRLPLMEECITEFIQELRARKVDGHRDLQVRLNDAYRGTYFSRGASLMMVDGVPVFDHETIYRYDPLLVETVNIYPYTYFIGSRGYNGLVNFVTYKRTLPSVTFPDNVRVIDFQGAALPLAYTCEDVRKDEYPDYRQTVYWNPVVESGEGEDFSFECVLPAYSGNFRIVVEGLTASGEPVFASTEFSVQ